MLGVFAAIFWGTFSSMGIVVTPGWGSRGADLGTKKQGGINTEATKNCHGPFTSQIPIFHPSLGGDHSWMWGPITPGLHIDLVPTSQLPDQHPLPQCPF